MHDHIGRGSGFCFRTCREGPVGGVVAGLIDKARDAAAGVAEHEDMVGAGPGQGQGLAVDLDGFDAARYGQRAD